MKKNKNDRALRFYTDVLELESLHYGLWLPDDELTFENFKAAQQRYEDFLVDHIPQGAKKILDVGCGIGSMSARLKKMGYDVEGLSPDMNQKTIFKEKVNARFHFCPFEEFRPTHKYDCIIMSESCQYIPLDDLFTVATNALEKNGYLMVSDYFVYDRTTGILAKSGHHYDLFIQKAKEYHFSIVETEDITEGILKTLDVARLYVGKVLLGLDIVTEKLRNRYPLITRLIKKIFRKKIAHHMEELDLLDSKKFAAQKRYLYILFQVT